MYGYPVIVCSNLSLAHVTGYTYRIIAESSVPLNSGPCGVLVSLMKYYNLFRDSSMFGLIMIFIESASSSRPGNLNALVRQSGRLM